MKKTLFSAALPLLALFPATPAPAASLKQPFVLASSNDGALYQGTGAQQLVPSGFFGADFQPFPADLGTLESFSISCRINGQLAGQAGTESELGKAGANLGGSFTIGGIAFGGIGGSGNGEAPTGDPLEVTFGIPDFDTTLVAANAGVTYHPGILEFLTGSSPVQISFGSSVNITHENVDNLAASVSGSIILTYTYIPAAGGPPATYRITRLIRNAASGEISLGWESEAGKSYSVDASENLEDWTLLQPVRIGADSSETTLTETVPPESAPRRFYRVRGPF